MGKAPCNALRTLLKMISRVSVRHPCHSSGQSSESEVCASAENCILHCFDMYWVDQLVGDTAGVHFIFEAGTAPVAIFCLKLDQVTV
jgi:hypothetical protein